MNITLTTAAISVLLFTVPAMAQDARPREIRFNDQIRPILTEHCFTCHGPDSASREADLRLDVAASVLESGIIVPGRPQESPLVERITSDDSDLVMPPPEFKKPLPKEDKQLLVDWIAQGAPWEAHWSFIKARRAPLPQPAGIVDWGRNPIDHFILREMRGQGLEPNAEADRHTLARRAALDITGLPPSDARLRAFLTDTSSGAFDRYVDALMASEHAGEHRARYWLDAARYGDTHGMHVDNYREIWPYRDWVVDAFNANMPFDQFVVEQIAGDLLPNPTLAQRIATGFNRCNITTSEGGAIPEEVNVRYMVDRVETTATVFLGLTAGCAVCHDHKYDPISQRDFYSLGAFFNNTTQPAMDGNQKDTPPVVTLPSAEHTAEWETLQSRRRQLTGELGRWRTHAPLWWPTREKECDHPVADEQLLLFLPMTEGESPAIELPESATWAEKHPAGRRGVRFGEKSEFIVDLPRLRSDEPLSISFWFRTPDRLMATNLFNHTAKAENGKLSGWKITSSTQGALTFELLDTEGRKIRALLPGEEALRPRSWQHVCVRYSGGQSNSSISILVNGRPGVLRNATEAYVEAVEMPEAKLKLAGRLTSAGLSDVRIYRRWVADEEVDLLAQDFALRRLVQSDRSWEQLSQPEQDLVAQMHRARWDENYRERLRELARIERRRDYIYSRSTTTLVMQEQPTPARAYVLERGEYDQRRDEVAPGVPAVLDLTQLNLQDDRPLSRLDLARWLVHPDHPLTARVMVNRLWQSVFGVGLVKTTEDFGVMGDRPSHPELLDWLAVEFVESGWNVNHMLRLMLTSATYQQSSRFTVDKLAKDSENRYLSRGPRLRLDAEVLRDQALAVSGLLCRELGGPSVKPYQPAGLWKVVAITGSNTRVFEKDNGEALYRRSLYTFWKRTAPPPSMAAFNAPTRESCTVRRERTNTPIQALVLMNDPQFVEAARFLAQRALRQCDDQAQRARWMFETVLRHAPQEDDLAEIAQAVPEFSKIFQADQATAKNLVETGDSPVDSELDTVELATWTIIANTLMNRDDFINK